MLIFPDEDGMFLFGLNIMTCRHSSVAFCVCEVIRSFVKECDDFVTRCNESCVYFLVSNYVCRTRSEG